MHPFIHPMARRQRFRRSQPDLVALYHGRLDGGISVARTGPKWHFNKNGILVTAADGDPGFGPNGLTIDPQRTNLLQADQHRTFTTGAGWATVTATVTKNQTGIDGVSNAASTAEDDNASGFEPFNDTLSISSDSTPYALLAFLGVDSDETRFPEFDLEMRGGALTSNDVKEYLQINTKTADTAERNNDGTFHIRRSPNTNFWMPDVRVVNNNTDNTQVFVGLHPAVTSTLDGSADSSATGSVVVDWFTLVNALFVGHPIPGATTRNADVVNGDTPDTWGATVDVVAFDFTAFAASMGTFFAWASYVDANNYTAILHDGSDWIARRRVGGVNHDATLTQAYTPGTTYRITGRFGDGICSIFVDKVKGTDNTDTAAVQYASGFKLNDGNDGSIGSWSVQRIRMDHGPHYASDAEVIGFSRD